MVRSKEKENIMKSLSKLGLTSIGASDNPYLMLTKDYLVLSLKCTQLNQHGLVETNSRAFDHFDHIFSPSLLLHTDLDGA